MRRASRVAATLTGYAVELPRRGTGVFGREHFVLGCHPWCFSSSSAPSDSWEAPNDETRGHHFPDPPPRPPHRRVVVTGIGLVTPLGAGRERTWRRLMNGETGVRSFGPADIPEGQDGYDQLGVRVAAVVPRRSGKIPDEPFDLQRWCDSPSVAPFSGYALCAAAEAVEDAGIGGVGGGGGEGRSSSKESDQGQSNLSNRFQVDPTRAGVSIGSGMGHVSDVTHAGRLLERGKLGKKLSPFFVPRVLCNAAAGQVSMAHDFRGPNRTTATACAAGAHAVGDAFRSIQRGDADLMLAGGTEACVDAVTIGGFARARALADPKQMGLFRVDETEGGFGSHGEHPKHELVDDKTDDTSVGDVASKPSSPSAHDETSQDYSTACRPFARTRGGFVVGEGAGVMVLESLEHALKRGVTKIYAEIRGFGQAGDAHHVTTPPSDGAGAARAMRAALQDAGVDPDSVDYVNAHATGTAAGDAAECAALLDVFGDRFSSGALAVSSTKGAVGHLLGAAGAVEAAFCALALFSSQTPPTLHLDAGALKGNADASKPGSQKDASRALKSRPEFPGVPPPGADLVRDANRNNQKTIVAMTNSFGFGGTNASLVFVKAPPVE